MIFFNLSPNKKSRAQQWRGNAKLHLLFKLFMAMGIAAFVGSFPLWASVEAPTHIIQSSGIPTEPQTRHPDSMRFPQIEETRDEDDILESYPRYLEFVLECSKTSHWRSAKNLEKKYRVLRQYSPKAAAKFLVGLRFELIQKIQFSHMDARRLSSTNRSFRIWAGQNVSNWYREADEHLFRAVVYRKTDRRWD